MSREQLYYVNGPMAGEKVAGSFVNALRLWRLELCSAWVRGTLPTFFFFRPAGRLRPDSVALTLRIGRAMIGYRWYYSK